MPPRGPWSSGFACERSLFACHQVSTCKQNVHVGYWNQLQDPQFLWPKKRSWRQVRARICHPDSFLASDLIDSNQTLA